MVFWMTVDISFNPLVIALLALLDWMKGIVGGESTDAKYMVSK